MTTKKVTLNEEENASSYLEHQLDIKNAFSKNVEIWLIFSKMLKDILSEWDNKKKDKNMKLILLICRNLLALKDPMRSDAQGEFLMTLNNTMMIDLLIVLCNKCMDESMESLVVENNMPLLQEIFYHIFGIYKDQVKPIARRGFNHLTTTTPSQKENQGASNLNKSPKKESQLSILRKKQKALDSKKKFELSGRDPRFGGVYKQNGIIYQSTSFVYGNTQVDTVRSRNKKYFEDWRIEKIPSYEVEAVLFKHSVMFLRTGCFNSKKIFFFFFF